MDNLQGLKTGAQAASENVAKFQEDIPGLLSGLKTNLSSIYAKDNPMMQAREGALQTYLNTPSSTRAELLPQNQPMVAGSPLNFSPTQQQSIVNARENAALVPLLGLNNAIVSQYGNIGDILSAAAQTYQSQLGAAQTRATSAMDLYKVALAEKQKQDELAMERYKADRTGGGGIGDLEQTLAILRQMGLIPGNNTNNLPITGGQEQESGFFNLDSSPDSWTPPGMSNPIPTIPQNPQVFTDQLKNSLDFNNLGPLKFSLGPDSNQGLFLAGQPGGFNF